MQRKYTKPNMWKQKRRHFRCLFQVYVNSTTVAVLGDKNRTDTILVPHWSYFRKHQKEWMLGELSLENTQVWSLNNTCWRWVPHRSDPRGKSTTFP